MREADCQCSEDTGEIFASDATVFADKWLVEVSRRITTRMHDMTIRGIGSSGEPKLRFKPIHVEGETSSG